MYQYEFWNEVDRQIKKEKCNQQMMRRIN